MRAARTLSSLRGAFPLVDAIVSFPSRSQSVSTIRSLTFRLRCAARAVSFSLSSAGMRSRTDSPSPGALPARPLGSNETANREARMPTAMSLRPRPVRRTSSARLHLSPLGMRTRTSLRLGASTEVLAGYLGARAQLGADRPDPLADREPGRRGEQGDRRREDAPRREAEARRDKDDAFSPRADPDVALQPERLSAGAGVGDQERSDDGREREGERHLVPVAHEDE